MIRRLHNWQSALSRYIVSRARTPFKYGAADCGLFVADALQAMTGDDVAAELRGTYTDRRAAFQAIEQLCGTPTMEGVAAFLASRHGLAEVPVSRAHRGDAVTLRRGARSSLGIVDLYHGFILTPYKFGLLRLDIKHATRAFHLE